MRRVLLIAVLVALGLLGYWGYFYGRPELSTHYAGPSVRSGFDSLREGASVDDIYGAIGAPLYISVNSLSPPVHKGYDYNVGKDHIKDLMNDTNVDLYLQFSTNNGRSGWYYRYMVEMRRGRVYLVRRDLQD